MTLAAALGPRRRQNPAGYPGEYRTFEHRPAIWKMIRFLVLLALLLLVAALALHVARRLKGAQIDWAGVTFAIGFVALAFWLRHVTGLG
jgi:hypothetical protein